MYCPIQEPVKTKALPSVVLIGTGNVAYSLGNSLLLANYDIRGIWGRNLEKSQTLASGLSSRAYEKIEELPRADLVFICVSDDSISEVSCTIPSHFNLIVHTSGSKTLDDLITSIPRAIFYPFQTFSSKRIHSFKGIPIFIETSDRQSEEILSQLAQNLGAKYEILNSDVRQVIHLAGVLSNNFSTLFIGKASEFLKSKGLSPSLLKSLLMETISKALENSLEESLTGPARRKDEKTIENQEAFLSTDKDLALLYRNISEYISKNYAEPNSTF